MRAKNAIRNDPKEKAVRKSRWHMDVDGRYHYAGLCPFNNSVCRLMNYFAVGMIEPHREVEQ